MGFIRLYLYDATFQNTLSGTLLINLRTDSIDGSILSSTIPVVLPAAFGGTVDFLFSTPVAVSPGTTYYFQPVVQNGNSWGVNAANFYNYAGGTAFYQGTALPNADLWFREGIVVPEPSATLLLLLGGGLAVWHRRRK